MSNKNEIHLYEYHSQYNQRTLTEGQLEELQKSLSNSIYQQQQEFAQVKSESLLTDLFDASTITRTPRNHLSTTESDMNPNLFSSSVDQKYDLIHAKSMISGCPSPSSFLSTNNNTHSLPFQFYQNQPVSIASTPYPSYYPMPESAPMQDHANLTPIPTDSLQPVDALYSLSPSSSSTTTTTTTDTAMIQLADSHLFYDLTGQQERVSMISDSDSKHDNTSKKPKINKKRRITHDAELPLDDTTTNKLSNSELRRQIHIQSEQKRRAQIKGGFEELRNELPSCLSKKMSKVALLHRTVQHIQHLKSNQSVILSEVERLLHENEQLKKFKESVMQSQTTGNQHTSAL